MASPTVGTSDLGHNNTTGATSLVVSVLAAVAFKETIVVAIQHTSAQTITTVVDSQGNVYNRQTSASVGGTGQAGLDIWIARCRYPLTTADTVTITPSASTSLAVQLVRVVGFVSRQDTATALYDVTKTGTGAATNTPTTSASGTLAVADELSLGFAAFTGNTSGFSAEATGYSTQQTVGNANGSLHYGSKAIAATSPGGTETYAPTLTGTPANSSVSLVTLRGSTVRYVNVSTGSDASNGLTVGTSKLTIAAAGMLAGDVVHVAKTTDPGTCAGTATWTTNSTTVSTTSDLTGVIAAKDFVAVASDGSAGWWEVSSITATTITLVSAYRPGLTGLTGAGLTMYKLTSAASNYVGFNTAGNIQATAGNVSQLNGIIDAITVIGGYNASDVRDGYTWMVNTNATRQGIFNMNAAYVNVSYIGMGRTARAFSDASGAGTGVIYDHCQAASSNGEGFYKLSSGGKYVSCVAQIQGNQIAFNHASGSNRNMVYDSCTVLQSGTSDAFNDNQASQAQFLNCQADGCASGFSWTGRNNVFYNCTANHCTRGFTNNSTSGNDCTLSGCVSSNASSEDFRSATSVDGTMMYLMNCKGNSTTPVTRSSGTITADKYQQTNGDYRVWTQYGAIVTNTSAFRTASPCTELQPSQGLNATSITTSNQDNDVRPDAYVEETWAIPVPSGVTRTVTMYIKKSATWTGDVAWLGIRNNGYWKLGTLPQNIVQGGTILTTSYQAYTLTYDNSAGPDQVVEVALQVNGTAGSVYVDDISWA